MTGLDQPKLAPAADTRHPMSIKSLTD